MMMALEENEDYKLPISNNEEGKKPERTNLVVNWFRKLESVTGWSLMISVAVVYGGNSLGGTFGLVATGYYLKDVQKVQPSQAQFYSGITSIPWIVKPIWDILTDVVPIFGYHPRPYFVFAGILSVLSMLFIALQGDHHIPIAVLLLTVGRPGVAIADVTIDACVAQNSASLPSLAADLQSLCALSSSIGALIGFIFSGILVHLIDPQRALALMVIPAGFVLFVGILLKEPYTPNFAYSQSGKFLDAEKAMGTTLICSEVWRPLFICTCPLRLVWIYIRVCFIGSPILRQAALPFLSGWLIVSWINSSQETIGYIYAVASVGSIVGAILYQYNLKHWSFRKLCFWSQLLSGLGGMLDLALVLRLNIKIGIPDYLFVVADACVSQMMGSLKWMPLLVLSSKLCPRGIEGTLFALLMFVDNGGLLNSSWGRGLLLHVLKVTRTRFDNLWLAILSKIASHRLLCPLFLLFLLPGKTDPTSSILPSKLLGDEKLLLSNEDVESDNVELVSLVDSVEGA